MSRSTRTGCRVTAIMSVRMRALRVLSLPLVILAALIASPAATAAAPRCILVSGPALRQPVLLGDWNDNLGLYMGLLQSRKAANASARSLVAKPKFRLSVFWTWRSGAKPPTRPDEARETGWFYPAHRSRVALIRLGVNGTNVLRVASPAVLAIFRAHRVPVRI